MMWARGGGIVGKNGWIFPLAERRGPRKRWTRIFLPSQALPAGYLGHLFLWIWPAMTVVGVIQLARLIPAFSADSDWFSLTVWSLITPATALLSVSLLRHRHRLPSGLILDEQEAPGLHRLIKDLCGEFKSGLVRRVPRIDRVCLSGAPTLEIIRTPRHGLPMFTHITLRIGLPLLQTMTGCQFKAALARKLGQQAGEGEWALARGFAHASLWRHYVRLRPSVARACLHPLFVRYVAWFERVSADDMRQYEQVGDEYAFRVAHPEDVADALLAMAVSQRFLEAKFWPAVNRQRGFAARPTHMPYAHLQRAYLVGSTEAERERWTIEALADTSPPGVPMLRERLGQLVQGVPAAPTFPMQSAATELLGSELQRRLAARLDRNWWKKNREQWAAALSAGRGARARVKALQEKMREKGLDQAELNTLMRLIREHVPTRQAMNIYSQLLASRPADARLHLIVGERMLQLGDAAGVGVLRRAAAMDLRYARMVESLLPEPGREPVAA